MNRIKQKAVFLDRDGTINIEKEYLYRPDDLEFISGVPEAIAQLNQAGFLVIVITNQSGVARGYFSVNDVNRLHQFMQQQLAAEGAHIDAFYLCPHHPDKGLSDYRFNCDCRKGKPGLILTAAAELDIDLDRSYMVGDKISDIEAGMAAGCRCFLVKTGYGEIACTEAMSRNMNIPIVTNLPAAVRVICQSS